ncbi:MAG: fatty acid oxidation complex subunit alpha FadJ [Bacteroidetes bacterium]|nr:fatty acid oxidation complex subunit alpha FadJ [Bacteroidota bacterium]
MTKDQLFTIEKSDNGVATIWMDQKDSKVNKVGPELINLFDQVFKEINEDDAIKAIVLGSKKKDFIAGADIEAFQKVKKPGDWAPITLKGHAILEAIEKNKKPIVAAINGSALGAGLEIALACTARICSDDKSTKLALPEVKLGLLPGGGGTQRLPELIGLQAALDMMLTGKNIFPGKAKKLGLVDQVVHKSALHNAAVKMALSLSKKKFKREDKRALKDRIIEGPLSLIVFQQARKTVAKQTHGNYPAPERIIDCVETGWLKGKKKGYAAEVEHFEKLLLGPESKQLINIFFAMTDKKKNPYDQPLIKPVKDIAMLGAGFMGAGITEVSITNDYNVLLKDINNETLSAAYQTIYKNFDRRVKKRAMSDLEMQETLGRIAPTLSYEGFQNVELVIEAVFEDINLKHKVLAQVEEATTKECIFASNTSALPIGEIAAAAKRPELVIGMHYFSPVPKMPLLEIIKTDKTADWVVATCYEVGKQQGKTCIVVNDGPGFYTTRILAPMMNEALLMLDEGADIKQIDKQMNLFGFPVGPVTLMDEVGIDVGAHIMSGDIMKKALESAGREMKISYTLLEVSKAGYKGRKNKKGFYQYDDKGKKKSEVDSNIYSFFGGNSRKQLDNKEIQMRAAMMMVNEAAYCLQEGIIESPLDGDIGAVFGLGFPPFLGGPFRYIDTIGANKAVAIMEELASKYGKRFEPASILKEHAKDNKKFYS